jgi:hypothetical protein
MLFGKLWVRIKGELLLLKDDLAAEGEVREKAEAFLEKLEALFREPGVKEAVPPDNAARLAAVTEKIEVASKQATLSEEPQPQDLKRISRPTAEELMREWDELTATRKRHEGDSPGKEVPPPNPRRLG